MGAGALAGPGLVDEHAACKGMPRLQIRCMADSSGAWNPAAQAMEACGPWYTLGRLPEAEGDEQPEAGGPCACHSPG